MYDDRAPNDTINMEQRQQITKPYSIFVAIAMICCLQMCGNPARHSGADRIIDIRDSCPKLERIFKSDRLQDSLMNFLRLIDTSDYFILSQSPGKFCRCTKPDHSYNVITLCCFTNNCDTIINFYGGIDGFIGFPASHKLRKIFIKSVAVGAKRVNNTMIAVNSYGSIVVDSVFDSLFLSRLDLEEYSSMVERSPGYIGNVIPFFKEYTFNGENIELVFSNEKKVEYLDTVKNLQEVFQ